MSEEKRDRGWEYLNSDGEEGSFYEDDGSWGYKNEDGSGSFYGADGSWGYRNADGSSSYYGKDGAWGYKNPDGSGAYYGGSNGEADYYDADDDNDESSSGSVDLFGFLAGVVVGVIGLGTLKYSQKREHERKEEAARQAKVERIRLEKKKERKEKNALRKQRVKAFLLRGKKIEIRYGYGELIGKSISFVLSALKEGAFTNIKTTPIKDIYIGSNYQVGQVEQIVISGYSCFRAGDMIPYDTEIVVTYHEKREIVIPFSEKTLRKLNYITASNKLRKLGFTEIYEHAICDLITGWVKKDGAVEKVTIGAAHKILCK